MRLARVEQILELALPQYAGDACPDDSAEPPTIAQRTRHSRRQRHRSSSSTPDEESPREEELPSAVGTLQENGRWFGPSAMESINSGPILEQFQNDEPPGIDEAAAAAEKLKSLIQDCGLPPHKLSELVQELPPKSLADVLINHFFKSINWTRYTIYESSFRTSYESVFSNGVRVHPLDVRFLPLLFIVLATSARLAPEHIVGDERQRRLTSLRYYWSCGCYLSVVHTR